MSIKKTITVLTVLAMSVLAGCVQVPNYGAAYEPKEIWHVYVRHAWCTGAGVLWVKDATGTLSVSANPMYDARAITKAPNKTISAKCKKKYQTVKYGYNEGDAGIVTLVGTRQEISQYMVKLNFKWYYNNKKKNAKSVTKVYQRPPVLVSGLPVGQNKTYRWTITGGKKPDFYMNVRFKRIQ